jgi:hypothetical protein
VPDTMTPLDERCWRETYRDGVLRFYSDAQLASVRGALLRKEPGLVQNTMAAQRLPSGPELFLPQSAWPVVGACLLCWPHWQADGVFDRDGLEVLFQLDCQRLDEVCGPLSALLVVRAWDDHPPELMRRWAFGECEKETVRRAEARARTKEGERCERGQETC